MPSIRYGVHLLDRVSFPVPIVSGKSLEYLTRNPGFNIIDGANTVKARKHRTGGRNAQLYPEDFDLLQDYMAASRSVLVINSQITAEHGMTPFLDSLLEQGRLFMVDCSRGRNMADDKFAIGLAVCYHGFIYSDDKFTEFLHVPTLSERRLGSLSLSAPAVRAGHALEAIDEDGFTLVVR